MRTYEKELREKAIKLSDEIGVGNAAKQLGIPYYHWPNGGDHGQKMEARR